MKRKTVTVLAAVVAALATAGGAFADQPPGQLGYEGQPGNQGGASGNRGTNKPRGFVATRASPATRGG